VQQQIWRTGAAYSLLLRALLRQLLYSKAALAGNQLLVVNAGRDKWVGCSSHSSRLAELLLLLLSMLAGCQWP
jgi:hypothetical protein